jgi:hypothetical protein
MRLGIAVSRGEARAELERALTKRAIGSKH